MASRQSGLVRNIIRNTVWFSSTVERKGAKKCACGMQVRTHACTHAQREIRERC